MQQDNSRSKTMIGKIPEPFFSVIIPTLNEEKRLPLILKDLEEQSLKDFEIIVVDAKSKDKTLDKVRELQKRLKDLKIIISQKRNVGFQRNLGAKKAKAKWIIFMDADNRISKNFLKEIKTQLDKYNPDILSTWMKPDTKRNKDKLIANLINLFIEFQKKTKRPSILEAFLCIKKDSFNKLKGFNEKIKWAEGSEMMERAVKNKMKFVFLKKPSYKTSFRRIHKEGTFKILVKLILLEINKVYNKSSSGKMTKILYPMNGGSYYLSDRNNKLDSKNILLKIREKITKVYKNKTKKLIRQRLDTG